MKGLRGALILLLGGALTMAAFSPILGNGFVNWDDSPMILDNAAFRGLGWSRIKWMFTTFHMTAYTPFGWALFAGVYAVQGLDPFGYHLASLLLHGANAALLYALTLRLLVGRFPRGCARGAALLGVLLWALHPLHAESVAWATLLTDLLCAFFFLASLVSYLRGIQGAADRKMRWLAFSGLLYLACGLSRWRGLTLPLAVILLDFYPLRRLNLEFRNWLRPPMSGVWLEKAAFVLVALAVIAVNHKAKSQVPGIYYFRAALPAETAQGLIFYVGKILLPFRLHPLYLLTGHPKAVAWPWPLCFAAAVTITALCARRPAALWAWITFCAGLLPSFACSKEGFVFAQDHYVYLPSLGLAVGASAALARAWSSWNRSGSLRSLAPLALAFGAAAVFGGLTWRQTRIWRDSTVLWTRVLAVDPASPMAHGNLGSALIEKERYDEAAGELRRQLAIDPGQDIDRANLANALSRKAWRDSEPARYYNNMAADLARRGLNEEAFFLLAKSLQIDPNLALTHANMSAAWLSKGRLLEAMRHRRRSRELLTPSGSGATLPVGGSLRRDDQNDPFPPRDSPGARRGLAAGGGTSGRGRGSRGAPVAGDDPR